MAPHADGSQGGQGNGYDARNMPKHDEYIQFECLPTGGPLNRWSHFMTREHDFPGAQASVL